MMLIDDLRIYVSDEPDQIFGTVRDAERRIQELIAAYDALAPDWSDAPWAKWYAIDPEGIAHWFHREPRLTAYATWEDGHMGADEGIRVDLPIGIDWRLCVWRRPEE